MDGSNQSINQSERIKVTKVTNVTARPLCLDVVKLFFQIATPKVIVRFLRKLAHMIYVPIYEKIIKQIFEILLSKFLANF